MPENSSTVAADIVAMLKARNPLICVVSGEEARVEPYLFNAAAAAGYVGRTWDCAAGVRDIAGKPVDGYPVDCAAFLEAVFDRQSNAPRRDNERVCWIMRDLSPWLQGTLGIGTVRWLKNVCRVLPGVPLERSDAMILISPNNEVPAELTNMATVVEWPLPDRSEIGRLLDGALEGLPEDMQAKAAPNGQREAAIEAAVGLSGEEVEACYARSIVQLLRIDPAVVHAEKKRVIARDGTLQWYDPIPGGLDAVGGLDLLKAWLVEMSLSYTAGARTYGLPAPKGVLVIGVTGCGKSLVSKCTATSWGFPLLKFDPNATKEGVVGASERKVRGVIRTVDAVGRAVLWVDEVEKALAGASGPSLDAGVSADMMGVLLTWMQERTGETFLMCTANDIRGLPPEFLRKGRFDEVFFVDLPTHPERIEVLKAGLREHGRKAPTALAFLEQDHDWDELAAGTDKLTGSEIVELVPMGMRRAYADDRRMLEPRDIIAAARTIVPVSRTMEKKIEEMRSWAKDNARAATSGAVGRAEAPIVAQPSRRIDVSR